jgi:cytochrome P460
MKSVLRSVLVAVTCLGLLAAAPEKEAAKPRYDQKGQLIRPDDYREWMFLSAGYGMNYTPGPDGHELFTNVFVQRWAYDEFKKSGKWPEKSMWVIDERDAASRSSINQKGHYQTDLAGLVAEVKDSARNPDKWTYYVFGANNKTAEAMPHGNPCYACHDAHAAVEHTFVQFYPTLKVMAKQFGTYNEAREQVTDAK